MPAVQSSELSALCSYLVKYTEFLMWKFYCVRSVLVLWKRLRLCHNDFWSERKFSSPAMGKKAFMSLHAFFSTGKLNFYLPEWKIPATDIVENSVEIFMFLLLFYEIMLPFFSWLFHHAMNLLSLNHPLSSINTQWLGSCTWFTDLAHAPIGLMGDQQPLTKFRYETFQKKLRKLF